MSADAAFAVVRSWMASKLNTPKAVIDALQRFIGDKAVGFREMADLPAHTVIGRDSASAGQPQAISITGGIEFTGTGSIQRSALISDVTAPAGSTTTTIAPHAVTNPKFRQSAGLSLVGNSTNATADVADITAASDGQVMRRSGTAIAFGAVDLANANAITGNLPVANLGSGTGATSSTFWRGDGTWAVAGSGTVTSVASADGSITVTNPTTTADLAVVKAPKLTTARTIAMSGDVVWSTSFDGSGNVTAAGTIQSNAVTTGKINNSAVTLAKIANAAANSVLLGAGAAGSGAAYAEISLGSGLTMTGTTLSASGASGTVTHTVGALTSGQLIVGNGTADIKTGDLSGDVSTSGSGVTTIGALKVATGMIQANAVTLAKLATQADKTILANIAGSTAVPTASGLSAVMDNIFSSTQGAVLYRGASNWSALSPGTSGQFLQTQGASANPQWVSSGGGGGTYPYEAAQTLPRMANFSWVNQGTATGTDVSNGISIVKANQGTADNFSLLVRSAPATPFSVIMRTHMDIMEVTGSHGILLRNSGTGALVMVGFEASGNKQAIYKYSSPSTGGTVVFSGNTYVNWLPTWLKVAVTSTTFTAYYGWDGINWIQFRPSSTAYSIATYLGTLDQVGIATNAYAADQQNIVTSWAAA
jgi:hypothetical protein